MNEFVDLKTLRTLPFLNDGPRRYANPPVVSANFSPLPSSVCEVLHL